MYLLKKFRDVREDVGFQVCEPLASSNPEFVVSLNVLCESRVDLFDRVIEDVILEAWTNGFIGCLLLVVVVLDDLTCSGCVGCDVRLDLLIEGCWCHCLRLVFDLSEVEEVDPRHSEVIVPFY